MSSELRQDSKDKKAKEAAQPLRPAAFVLPTVLAVAHATFLASNYETVLTDFAESGQVKSQLWVPATLASLYLIGVWAGSKVMKNRQSVGKAAFNCSEAMVVYNVYATILSAFMGIGIFKEAVAAGKGLWTEQVDFKNGGQLAFLLWVNYHSKFIEYCDTLFMILRYKWDQVTFLHVSHHAEMGLIMWLVNHLSPGGNSYFGPMINSFVHTVMYAYYGLSGVGIRLPGKAAITLMQMVQFVAILVQDVWLLLPDNYNVYWPATLATTSLILMFQMLSMFGNFFVGAYVKPGDKEKAAKQEGEGKKQGDAAQAVVKTGEQQEGKEGSKVEGKEKAPLRLRPLAFILPALLACAHATFLASNYTPLVDHFYAHRTVIVPLWRPVALAATYLLFVLIGKRVFKAREKAGKPAFNIAEAMVVYNIYATLLSAYMGLGMLTEVVSLSKYAFTDGMDYENGGHLAFLLWVNYHSKFIEYCDTLFMILRYKWDQVTFLHVSHHTEMGLVMWIGNELSPGGNSYFGPMINSFVHTVMYAYYGLSGVGTRVPFKAALTALQLLQFVAILVQDVWHILPDNYNVYWPATLAITSLVLMFQMLTMFSDFFIGAYITGTKGSKGKGKKGTNEEGKALAAGSHSGSSGASVSEGGAVEDKKSK